MRATQFALCAQAAPAKKVTRSGPERTACYRFGGTLASVGAKEDGHLLAEREVLEGEGGTAPKERAQQKPDSLEEQHGIRGLLSGSGSGAFRSGAGMVAEIKNSIVRK